MAARQRGARPATPRPSGQHLLRSDAIAQELVDDAALADAVVLEIGAGTGRLTEALGRAARSVIAVELDPVFAEGLRHRFHHHRTISVREADVLSVALPLVPYRAFGNVPFSVTTAILRRLLDDPSAPLLGADLIVQFEAARKRAAAWPTNLASLGWMPWWEFALVRHLPRTAFEPAPSVDAAVLSIRRRRRPLLPAGDRGAYLEMLRVAFHRSNLPIRRSLGGRIPTRGWKRLARERGIDPNVTAPDLDVFGWTALFTLIRGVPHDP